MPSPPFNKNANMGMRFGALQIRKPSGRPQGILNVGMAVLDSSMRSMPLYTHNPSAVGYRHFLGDKGAYDDHHNLSPSSCAKPELRRTKSDTSSMIGSNVVMQQRARSKGGKGSSVIEGSEVGSFKSRRKRRSRSSKVGSVVSGSEVSKRKGKSGKASSALSDSNMQWKAKVGKSSSALGAEPIEQPVEPIEQPKKDSFGNLLSVINDHYIDPPKNVKDNLHEDDDSNQKSNSLSKTTTEKVDAFENERIVQKTNNVYEVKASPKPQFRNSPMHPPAGYGGSQKTTPMHPTAGYGGSCKATPMHLTAGYGGSCKATPMHQAAGYGGSCKATPMHQTMGYGGPCKATPMHLTASYVSSQKATPRSKFSNPTLEYMTPRRSNLGGAPPPVMTNSELGPSPSEVAAAMVKFPRVDEGEESMSGWSLDESVEGLQSKLERWRSELPPVYDRGELPSYPASSKSNKTSHRRRHTDGGNGLFSCFSNICGCQCTIVCGGDNKKKKAARHRHAPSASDTGFL